MGAALAAFFGDPIGGPLFALEIPHRRGLEYYEAIIPAMVAGICSFAVFRMGTGLAVGGIYNFGRFGDLPGLTWLNLLEGAGLGLVGALAGILFIGLFRLMKWMIQKNRTSTYPISVDRGPRNWLDRSAISPNTLF